MARALLLPLGRLKKSCNDNQRAATIPKALGHNKSFAECRVDTRMVGATRGILIFSGGWGRDSDFLTGCDNASFMGTGDFRKRNQYHNSVL